ncbi:MAG: ABC transporter substrate-binding protein [Gemmatimonadales bacterium]|nr:ABC transporter substrate-binding protein [Gemmatimonadales bacterium]NIN12733.1 ABC transporter substrate-binding protein [Gemmatimonadales bacterium]NIQ99624.1 ABC transporter substrate-binding protein [Gemmatimonadales bacterium]NIS64181.1 ABC transporter substrate-binding protein [Gemmatimonadales bacterium]
MRTIRLAHSPDADDAFMFYALAAGKIPTGDRRYQHELADIETLNQRAFRGELEVTAVSLHAYAYLAATYALLPHGASMGDRYGPRLVAREPVPAAPRSAIQGMRIAIPGALTTAALVLRLYQPDFEAVVVPFDRIEEAVITGDVDAGVLIHEAQLTYAEGGLNLWVDMGEWWFAETGFPLPLGGNAVRRDLGAELINAISRELRASIVYSLEHREEALTHAMQYARGLDRATADRFVGMYVNDYTVDYGPTGRQAVHALLERGGAAGIIPQRVPITFVDDTVGS